MSNIDRFVFATAAVFCEETEILCFRAFAHRKAGVTIIRELIDSDPENNIEEYEPLIACYIPFNNESNNFFDMTKGQRIKFKMTDQVYDDMNIELKKSSNRFDSTGKVC